MRVIEVIEDHVYNEILTKVLGWKWMSFIGIPTRSTEGYPDKCRVRQLFSPKQLAMTEWADYFAKHEGREADGTEPLAYRYCSSQGPAIPPKISLLVEDR